MTNTSAPRRVARLTGRARAVGSETAFPGAQARENGPGRDGDRTDEPSVWVGL